MERFTFARVAVWNWLIPSEMVVLIWSPQIVFSRHLIYADKKHLVCALQTPFVTFLTNGKRNREERIERERRNGG